MRLSLTFSKEFWEFVKDCAESPELINQEDELPVFIEKMIIFSFGHFHPIPPHIIYNAPAILPDTKFLLTDYYINKETIDSYKRESKAHESVDMFIMRRVYENWEELTTIFYEVLR